MPKGNPNPSPENRYTAGERPTGKKVVSLLLYQDQWDQIEALGVKPVIALRAALDLWLERQVTINADEAP